MITETPQINRDLARWSRRQWALVFLLIFTAHLTALYWTSVPIRTRPIYPNSPGFSLTEADAAVMPEENPLLFAVANWNGFSADAWMQRPELPSRIGEKMPPSRFLSYSEANELLPGHSLVEPLPAPSYRMALRPLAAPLPGQRADQSLLSVEGALRGRPMAAPPNLPLQLHSEPLRSSVVEAGVDPDGIVVSARVVESSGLKQADLEALALARQIRFAPARSADEASRPLTWGKLIFDWFTLDLGSTNAVRR